MASQYPISQRTWCVDVSDIVGGRLRFVVVTRPVSGM